MKKWIAFWNIIVKDMQAYYLKPPNISWGLLFPLAWTGMFFIRTGSGIESIVTLLPGLATVAVLFGTTSMIAVTINFEKRTRSLERLLLAPISLELLLLAKTSGAILFGVLNAFMPILIASFLIDLSGIEWGVILPALLMMAMASSFLGLLIAVSVKEVFEAQTLSNFLRFPMLFLCGLFFPLDRLPMLLRPLSFLFPVTYGVDALKSGFGQPIYLNLWVDFLGLAFFCGLLFFACVWNARRKLIV